MEANRSWTHLQVWSSINTQLEAESSAVTWSDSNTLVHINSSSVKLPSHRAALFRPKDPLWEFSKISNMSDWDRNVNKMIYSKVLQPAGGGLTEAQWKCLLETGSEWTVSGQSTAHAHLLEITLKSFSDMEHQAVYKPTSSFVTNFT